MKWFGFQIEPILDGDEPLLSGTGLVSKDCSEDVLENWADVLSRWKSTKQKPKQLTHLVRLGIPEALRGEVWQRLAGIDENKQMMENYRLLITKVWHIQWDTRSVWNRIIRIFKIKNTFLLFNLFF